MSTLHQGMGRRHCRGGYEYDARPRNRHWYCYLQHAGVVSRIKRGVRRRERRVAKREWI